MTTEEGFGCGSAWCAEGPVLFDFVTTARRKAFRSESSALPYTVPTDFFAESEEEIDNALDGPAHVVRLPSSPVPSLLEEESEDDDSDGQPAAKRSRVGLAPKTPCGGSRLQTEAARAAAEVAEQKAKKQRVRELNRESARRCRQKKASQMEQLQATLRRLTASETFLRTQLFTLGLKCNAVEAQNEMLRRQLAELGAYQQQALCSSGSAVGPAPVPWGQVPTSST
eukprot:RCo000709